MKAAEKRPALPLMAAAALLLALTLAFHWPGTLNVDSEDQLRQGLSGQLNDWHPPIVAVLWASLGGTPQTMLLLQVVPYWLGFLLFALSVQDRSRRWSWALLLLGLSPIGLHQMGELQKDSLLASLLVFGMGLLAFTGRRSIAFMPVLIGSLCRINGVFALAPLLVGARHGWLRMLALALLASALLIPAAGLINRSFLQAQPSGVQRTLQWFDLAGIATHSGDRSVLPVGTTLAPGCYTSLFWDSLKAERCGGPLARLPESLTRLWLESIARHRVAYVRHRAGFFNSATFFLVPPLHQCVEAPAFHACDFSARGYLKDAIEKNFLLWPILWLAIGLLLLRERLGSTERIILASGLLYGLTYAVVGVAAQFRYFLWTELAVQLVLVLHLANGGTVKWRGMLALATLIVTAGYVARYAPLLG